VQYAGEGPLDYDHAKYFQGFLSDFAVPIGGAYQEFGA